MYVSMIGIVYLAWTLAVGGKAAVSYKGVEGLTSILMEMDGCILLLEYVCVCVCVCSRWAPGADKRSKGRITRKGGK